MASYCLVRLNKLEQLRLDETEESENTNAAIKLGIMQSTIDKDATLEIELSQKKYGQD